MVFSLNESELRTGQWHGVSKNDFMQFTDQDLMHVPHWDVNDELKNTVTFLCACLDPSSNGLFASPLILPARVVCVFWVSARIEVGHDRVHQDGCQEGGRFVNLVVNTLLTLVNTGYMTPPDPETQCYKERESFT